PEYLLHSYPAGFGHLLEGFGSLRGVFGSFDPLIGERCEDDVSCHDPTPLECQQRDLSHNTELPAPPTYLIPNHDACEAALHIESATKIKCARTAARCRHRNICRVTLFISGRDDLALARNTILAIGNEPICLG